MMAAPSPPIRHASKEETAFTLAVIATSPARAPLTGMSTSSTYASG